MRACLRCRWLRPPATAVFAAAVLLLPACDRARAPRTHRLVEGVVESVRPDAGQLIVRRTPIGRDKGDPRLACLLTSDSEIYINDRFCRAEEIVAGDTVEVIGTPDTNPRSDWFLVLSARITRTAEAPRDPELPRAVPEPRSQEN